MGMSHFPCGSVDWNDGKEVYMAENKSHFPCGSVDWNLLCCLCCCLCCKVTSLAEVWIETLAFPSTLIHILSLPLRKCGLKLTQAGRKYIDVLSLPLRKCGLKPLSLHWQVLLSIVTSLAEVWIETCLYAALCLFYLSLPLRKCGLKLLVVYRLMPTTLSLPLRKCGLKRLPRKIFVILLSHFPCGSVDWNCRKKVVYRLNGCHFPCGSVDWNSTYKSDLERPRSSLPLRKCGLKLPENPRNSHETLVTSLAEVWIETHPANRIWSGSCVTSLAEVWIETSTYWKVV